MYASTGDQRFLDRVTYIVNELAECQRANATATSRHSEWKGKSSAKSPAAKLTRQDFGLNGGWVPWYTMHKEFAG